MDYAKHYQLLVDRARNRVLDGYVERHHVVPRCIGGSEAMDNIVQLTAEEHYVAHQLLHKMYPKVKGLAYAMVCMTADVHGKRPNNRIYGWVRRRIALATKEQSDALWADEAYREKHKIAMQGVRSDPAVRAKISASNKGRVKSAQERANIAEAGRNRKPRKFSDEARANMAAARRKAWEERRANGTDKVIGQKTAETRRKNGSYEFTEEHRAAIGRSALGRIPWNKKPSGD